MKSIAALPVVRVVRVAVNIFWYLGWIMIPIAILMSATGAIHVPWYRIQIQMDSTRTIGEMNLLATGQPVKFTLLDDHNNAFNAAVILEVEPPSRLWAVLWNILALLETAMAFYQLYLMRKLFSSVRGASPFTHENVVRVRAIGLIWVIGYLANSLFGYLLSVSFSRQVVTHGFHVVTGSFPNFNIVFYGLMIVALAELFRYGVELEEEKALTI
jgi:hypothetical protein